MGKTKWYAASEEGLSPGGRSSKGRSTRRRVGVPSRMRVSTSDDIGAEELLRILQVRLQRLWVALKFRAHSLRLLLFQSRLLFKLGLVGALGYFVLYSDTRQEATPTPEPSSRPISWKNESPAPEEAAPSSTSEVPAPQETPVTKGVTVEHPQVATDPTLAWIRPGDEEKVNRYVERFHKIAVQEMHRYGIPASISLAQGLIESRFGTSTLAVKNNNHFGIKCFSKKCRPGHCTNLEDDHHKDFFRKYATAWESWRAHSILISTGRYARLKKHGRDYRAWAKGLEELGYATDRAYAAKLIDVIERFHLHRFDHQSTEK